jgi:hypothetical protein
MELKVFPRNVLNDGPNVAQWYRYITASGHNELRTAQMGH